MSDFDEIGASRLRSIIEDYVRRVTSDPMIGYMFDKVDRIQLAQREYEFTARFLGARNIAYHGRSLRTAHTKHRIFGGQFARRTQIVREVLEAQGVDPAIQSRWLAHIESLRSQVTGQSDTECE